jgi:dihydropyrimidinase/allantoinase
MDVELLIDGGTVVTAEGEGPGWVAVDAGRIRAVGSPGEAPPTAAAVVDATGRLVLPGLIDTHVHARDPSRNEREDFGSATAAAAAGGITTILEMPISTPSVHSDEILRARADDVGRRAHVDFGLYGGAAADNADDIERLAAAGAVAFKTFRTPVPVGREREFIGLCAPDVADYRRAMDRVARTGLVGAVHAEDATELARLEARLRAEGDAGPLSHARWRPPPVETGSVRECLAVAAVAGARIGIAHASTPEVVDLVSQAREAGLDATVETCPHYLYLTVADLERFGPWAKINPPLRDEAAVDGLWERVRSGAVDYVGSDHSPFLVEEKAPYRDDMWRALPGAPGLEALLPLMLSAVADGRIGLRRMVEVTSGAAARVFGLRDKGRIAPGADADLALVDPGRRGAIDTSRWLSRSRGTAEVWNGRPITGAVSMTIVRGRVVWDEGRGLVGPAGWGRWVRPG